MLFLEYDQGNVLEILETLLQIDLYLVEPRLQLLWPIMLNVSKKTAFPNHSYIDYIKIAFGSS